MALGIILGFVSALVVASVYHKVTVEELDKRYKRNLDSMKFWQEQYSKLSDDLARADTATGFWQMTALALEKRTRELEDVRVQHVTVPEPPRAVLVVKGEHGFVVFEN